MDITSGAYRQRSSGALIFPPSPEQRRYMETKKELDKELEEIRKLKQELQELVNSKKEPE